MPWNSWRGGSMPLRGVWAIYREGGRRAREAAPVLAVPYWLLAPVAFLIHCGFRLGQDSTTSLTRTFVFVITVVVFIAGVVIF